MAASSSCTCCAVSAVPQEATPKCAGPLLPADDVADRLTASTSIGPSTMTGLAPPMIASAA